MFHVSRVAAACAAACLAPAVFAQSTSTPSQTVVITGNPLQRSEARQPASVLGGDELVLRRAGTLGDTLDGLPGVSGSGFGPNSNRPVVRGLDGDRVRLLDNGGASVDASNLSFDHAVAIDPLVVERIEVLRGPAALLYGGNATGGVVNTIDNRIPRSPATGLGGRAELRLGGASAERSAGAVLEGGQGAWAWHVDGFGRRSDDQRSPRFTPVEDGVALDPATRVRNSAADAQGGALGASWFGSGGWVGASLDSYRNHYGVTVEPDVTIRMRRERAAAAGEWRLGGPFAALSFQAGHTRYQHQELEGDGAVGTTFRSRGSDLRVELRQASVGPWSGMVGLQAESLDFSALGEEAFVPATRSRGTALFTLQELAAGPFTVSAGLRAERARVASDGDAPGAAELRFGAAQARRFSPASASLGASWKASPQWTFNASLGHTERAPAYYELFANGVHVATAAYERGDPTLGVERSRHAELGLKWADGGHEVKAQVFETRFSRFIALEATGNDIPVDAGTVPEYNFRAVRARMHGLELEGRLHLMDAPWRLDLTGGLDLVRGRNADTGEPLPRLAPRRLRVGLEAAAGAWRVGLALKHQAAQTAVPATDVATPGATLASLSLGWQQRLGGADALWFLRADNLGDTLAFNASAVRTVRELSPLPGRSLAAGVRLSF